MRSPVLITPPDSLPVTLDEAKLHLRVDGADDDSLITGLLNAAVSHLDGWTGILGRCLVEQTWRMDFDTFAAWRLPLAPISEIVSITWRNEAGEVATVSDTQYSLRDDERGQYVYWDRAYSFPTGLYESRGVSVTIKAGYPTTPAVVADPEADPPVEAVPAVSTVPAAIKAAILLMVGNWYRYRSADVETSVASLPLGADALLAPYRRWSI